MKIRPELLPLAAALLQDTITRHPRSAQTPQELGALFAQAYQHIEQASQQLVAPPADPPFAALSQRGL